MSNHIALAIALLLSVATAACAPESGSQPAAAVDGTDANQSNEPSPVVAVIGDREITLDELDTFARQSLFDRETRNGEESKLYELRASMIDRLIDTTLVEEAAAAEQMTPSEFLESRVIAEHDVSDEEVRAYYDANQDRMGDRAYEDLVDRIRDFLRSQRAGDVVAKLRTDAGARVLMEPPRIQVAATGPAKGPANAPVTIVEFSDFQCPYCQRVLPTLDSIVEAYPEQVRVVFRHLPLDRIHPRARAAAEASACADKQGSFWPYHDRVFANNRALADADLEQYATDVGLDVDAFRQCVSDREFQAVVATDSDDAEQLGLTGTPAFFINGIPVRGAVPLEKFVSIIDSELARAATPSG